MRYTILTTIASIGLLTADAPAQSNIDDTVPNKHAWSENAGYSNWRDSGNPPGDEGVLVTGLFMQGFIWCENIGYINVGNGGGPYANDPGDSSTFGQWRLTFSDHFPITFPLDIETFDDWSPSG